MPPHSSCRGRIQVKEGAYSVADKESIGHEYSNHERIKKDLDYLADDHPRVT